MSQVGNGKTDMKVTSFYSMIRKKNNSHAVGKAVWQPLDFEIDFARNPISGSAA